MDVALDFGGVEIKIKGPRGWLTLGGMALVGAAVARELTLPPARRTWHGDLFDLVPYDLRPPTLDRVQSAMWNPSEARLLNPTAFGVGWSVNLARLADLASRSR